MKPVIAWLRGQGVRMIIFLNNILVLAPTIETINHHTHMTISLLESLGFFINYRKSTLVPTQRILFLGMLIDSTMMEFVLPTKKSENIQRECQNLLKTQQPSIRQISRVLGLLKFTRPAIWSAPLHYCRILLPKLYVERAISTRKLISPKRRMQKCLDPKRSNITRMCFL